MSADRSVPGSAEAAELAEDLLAGLATDVYQEKDRIVIALMPDVLPEAALRLRDHARLSFKYLSFVSGIDYEDRMDAIYILRSVNHQVVAELRVRLDRGQPVVPTVSNVWSTAGWHEREAYDLLGIVFEGHPDLRRILTRGEDGVFPLRKDAQPHRVRRDEWRFDGIAEPRRLPGEGGREQRS